MNYGPQDDKDDEPSPLQRAEDLIASLKADKPNDRTETDRRFAIAITEAEKLMAYIVYFL